MSSQKITPKNLAILRHSTAHILAAAVLEMFPEAKFAIGPAIDNGFYYDFDLPRTLIPEDLAILEEKMRTIIAKNYKFEKAEVKTEDALKDFQKAKQDYKVEIIKDLEAKLPSGSLVSKSQKVIVYRTGSFVDLCTGPHLDSTGEINSDAFKLTKISGAYWKGDEKNKMLQHIYGVVFESKKELDTYLKNQEEAEKRDHKKIGKELDLFSFHPEAPGSPFWHPKGMIIWNELEKLGKILRKKYEYLEVQTPVLAKTGLWKTSGHWEHYKDSMFHFKLEHDEYALKPMDCPFNILLYKEKNRSYKDLPIRYSEIGRVFRHEKSGELNGLLRVQNITQDDAHIFASDDQVESEIRKLLKMVKEYYGIFGINPEFFLATRPDENFLGKIATWDKAEADLKKALNSEKINYELKEKDAAFYGPKIDIDMKDALGRRWQLATIQLDFQLPERFELEYTNKEGKKETPVIIHAAIFGAFERFIGILTEHWGGAFPLWLSPVQVIIIPVSEKFKNYAKSVRAQFIKPGIRFEIDDSDESLGKRISLADKQKIPYIIVVGEKEEKSSTIVYREHSREHQRSIPNFGPIKLDKFIEKIKKKIEDKK